jgi:hypothetical protein
MKEPSAFIKTPSGKVIYLYEDDEGLLSDLDGTIYALRNSQEGKDPDQCGVGLFSLPPGFKLSDACKVHDYMYESPVYQKEYTREDADKYLESAIEKIAGTSVYKLLAKPFRLLARLFGRGKWENAKTR